VGYDPEGSFTPNPDQGDWGESLYALLEAASCCNNARLNPPSDEHPTWTSLGDQTEAAMKVAFLKTKQETEAALALIYPRVHEIPFDARRKRMSTIHRNLHEFAPSGRATRSIATCTRIMIGADEVAGQSVARAANDEYARNARCGCRAAVCRSNPPVHRRTYRARSDL
jgi:magnesium-transporting ATPase (P-type)